MLNYRLLKMKSDTCITPRFLQICALGRYMDLWWCNFAFFANLCISYVSQYIAAIVELKQSCTPPNSSSMGQPLSAHLDTMPENTTTHSSPHGNSFHELSVSYLAFICVFIRQLLFFSLSLYLLKTSSIKTLQIFPVWLLALCHSGHCDNSWVRQCGDASLPVSVKYHRPNEWLNQRVEILP